MSGSPKIKLADNGPLLVENPPDLSGSVEDETSAKPMIALCRCGASSRKPYCDGSHTKIDFDSTPDHSKIRNTAIDYTAKVGEVDVTVSYTPVLCTHAAQCQAKAGSVFKPHEKPWVQPEHGTLEEISEVMAACPSGALRIGIGHLEPRHITSDEVGITVEKDGPYHVTNVDLEAEFNGVGASEAKYSLCRCGLSKNKPFCDGTHHDAHWSDEAD